MLDGIGGFTCYGTIDRAEVARQENLLPMGLSEGCRLKRDILKDQPITYNDIDVPPGRPVDRLRAEQNAYFASRCMCDPDKRIQSLKDESVENRDPKATY
jgi:predicted homoserine dehydrogenase-like protein